MHSLNPRLDLPSRSIDELSQAGNTSVQLIKILKTPDEVAVILNKREMSRDEQPGRMLQGAI